jgi:hypothetical protein
MPAPASPFGFSVSDKTKLTSPAFGRAQAPTSAIGSYINQQLANFSTNRPAPRAAPANTEVRQSQLSQAPASSVGFGGVAESGQRMAADLARSNARVRQSLQIAQQKRQRRQQELERASSASGGGVSYGGGGNNQQGVIGAGGPTVNRIQGLLRNFRGLRITEVGGNRDYDVAHGVARVPTSYHYDRANPAVDIGGSTAELNALYAELVRQGGWRQILWQVPGHYDHIHVA